MLLERCPPLAYTNPLCLHSLSTVLTLQPLAPLHAVNANSYLVLRVAVVFKKPRRVDGPLPVSGWAEQSRAGGCQGVRVLTVSLHCQSLLCCHLLLPPLLLLRSIDWHSAIGLSMLLREGFPAAT